MNLHEARIAYSKNQITFEELDEIFFCQALKHELEKYWSAPVFDRPGVIMGKTQKQLDNEWNNIIS